MRPHRVVNCDRVRETVVLTGKPFNSCVFRSPAAFTVVRTERCLFLPVRIVLKS
jgi:hypothetical protein